MSNRIPDSQGTCREGLLPVPGAFPTMNCLEDDQALL